MVLAKLGCEVCATDLASNLPLLAHNFERNGKPTLTRLLRCSLHHPCMSDRLLQTGHFCACSSEGLLLWRVGLAAEVLAHSWGTSTASLRPPFDVVVACGTRSAGSFACRVLVGRDMACMEGLRSGCAPWDR